MKAADSNAPFSLYLQDIIRFREFFLFLLWRDLLVRYKQTLFGILWAIFRPLINLLVFASIFGMMVRVPAGAVSYPLFAILGILPWQLVSSSMMETSSTLVAQAGLLTKVYFPRVYMPTSLVLLQTLDLLIGFLFFLPFLFVGGAISCFTLLLFLPLLLWTALLAWGIGLWLSAYSLLYRDFRILTPFMTQAGMLLTPIAYSTDMIPPAFLRLYALNPMVGMIDAYRWLFLGVAPPQAPFTLLVSLALTCAIAGSGFWVFYRKEALFADYA